MTNKECKEIVKEIISYSGTIDRMDSSNNDELKVSRDGNIVQILGFMTDLVIKTVQLRWATEDCDGFETGKWETFIASFNLFTEHKEDEKQLIGLLEKI